jgi:Arc/MetJ-type ribon-helix-helix transcriptional regulator
MKRTTVKLPEDLTSKVRDEAKRRGTTISELTREALEAHLGQTTSPRRRGLGVGLGHTQDAEISERIGEILRAEDAR